MSDDESSIRESSFCVLPKLKWKALMWCWMLWKFESANIYLNESEGKLPQLTLIFSSNTNIPQLHSLTLSPPWISSPENLFSANQYWIKLSSSSQPSVKPVILSEHVSTMARVHWVARICQWYSCYALCFVIIPGISTFSQNKAGPLKYLINIETSKFICIKTNQIKKRGRGRLYLWRSWRKTSPQDSKCISVRNLRWRAWSHPLNIVQIVNVTNQIQEKKWNWVGDWWQCTLILNMPSWKLSAQIIITQHLIFNEPLWSGSELENISEDSLMQC